VTRQTKVAREKDAAAGLERLKDLEDQLALAPRHSRQRRTLVMAIRVEADAYRKSLDLEQAMATHDPHSRFVVEPGSPKSPLGVSIRESRPRRRTNRNV
jgi:hypothetical protein